MIFVLILAGCSSSKFKSKWLQTESPQYFKAVFTTTRGDFEIKSYRKWSPQGVDRLYQLITYGYFDSVPVYRMIPNYVAQFGKPDSIINSQWGQKKVLDEPVIEKNVFGTMAFARDTINTRGLQLFINLKNNSPRLDTIHYSGVTGFPVIAKVTSGMKNVKAFFSYGAKPMNDYDSISKDNLFIRRKYPKIDYILKAEITTVKEK
ncbi:peptidylprolyl isomerase [Spongiivirga citrea]|uniref:peptidylprolyl isomerase n=1 Tax=Spongiivirga citrea TaxID=1481457 RepID=UPI001EF7C47B|nr:peptidylprolyl isomerase [Spongiivirga citrea]